VAAGACIDPEIFFFENVQGNSEFGLTATGPAGEFTVDVVFHDGTSGTESPLPTPPGTKTLPAAKGKTHLVSCVILFATSCEVKVEATVAAASYCRKITGIAGDTSVVTLLMRMAS
jgi:hypothetical protein